MKTDRPDTGGNKCSCNVDHGGSRYKRMGTAALGGRTCVLLVTRARALWRAAWDMARTARAPTSTNTASAAAAMATGLAEDLKEEDLDTHVHEFSVGRKNRKTEVMAASPWHGQDQQLETSIKTSTSLFIF